MITGEKRKVLFQKKDKLAVAEQAIAAQEQARAAAVRDEDAVFYEELLEFAVSLANKLQACGAVKSFLFFLVDPNRVHLLSFTF